MDIRDFFRTAVQEGGISDIHLTVNSKPIVRKTGELKEYSGYPEVLTNEKMEEILRILMNEEQLEEFEEKGELDFSYSIPGLTRFRVNAYRQRGTISVALRAIPTRVPSIEELGLPEILKQIALQRNGLVLCTGPTGSGKSTTLAAMINEINEKRNCHILTLEDPIEYLYTHKNCIVHQREVGIDTRTFAAGLRAALRQDPDVILVVRCGTWRPSPSPWRRQRPGIWCWLPYIPQMHQRQLIVSLTFSRPTSSSRSVSSWLPV